MVVVYVRLILEIFKWHKAEILVSITEQKSGSLNDTLATGSRIAE